MTSLLDLLGGNQNQVAPPPPTPGVTPMDTISTDPFSTGLAGLAKAAADAAAPHGYKMGLGQVLGLSAAGLQGGIQQASVNAQAQAQSQQAQLNTQLTRATMPSLIASYADANSAGANGSYGPNDALTDMRRYQLRGDAKGYAAAADNLRNMMQPGGQLVAGQVAPVAGTANVLGTNAAAVDGAKVGPAAQMGANQAQTDIYKARAMLPIEQQKAMDANMAAAGADWYKPQSYTPGTVVGSPNQIQGNQPGAPDPFPGWAQGIQAGENGTGNPGAKNPLSSATGNGQFIDSTWLNLLPKVRPDLASLPVGQQLALRSNPDVSSQMTEAYARQNASQLAQSGVPVTGATVAAAHRFGPDGAVKLASADPNTPMPMLFSQQVISANPDLAKQTAGQVLGGFGRRMGGGAPVQQVQATPPPQTAPTPQPGPPQGAPAVVPGVVENAEAKARGDALAALPKEVNGEAATSQQLLGRLDQAQSAIEKAAKGGIAPGFFSPQLAEAAAAAKSLGVNLKSLGVDPGAIGDAQTAHEALTQINGGILKQLFPQRTTNMDIKMFGEALPNMGMDPASLSNTLAVARAQAQYNVGRGQHMNQFQVAHGGSLNGWEPQFLLDKGYGPNILDALNQAGSAQKAATDSNAPQASATPAIREGMTATGPNGHKMVFTGGAWVPK